MRVEKASPTNLVCNSSSEYRDRVLIVNLYPIIIRKKPGGTGRDSIKADD